MSNVTRTTRKQNGDASVVPNPKRKHVTLTIKEKGEILFRLENGENGMQLARAYGVGKSTITDIKKNKDKIKSFIESAHSADYPGQRKTMKKPNNRMAEESLHEWYLEEKSKGNPITRALIISKAQDFYEQTSSSKNFQASGSWFDRFKKRFGIKLTPGSKTTLNDGLSSETDQAATGKDSPEFFELESKFQVRDSEYAFDPQQTETCVKIEAVDVIENSPASSPFSFDMTEPTDSQDLLYSKVEKMEEALTVLLNNANKQKPVDKITSFCEYLRAELTQLPESDCEDMLEDMVTMLINKKKYIRERNLADVS